MIRDIDICFTSAQKVSAQSYEHNGTFSRVIVEIDNLTIRLDPEAAQKLRDALDGVLSDLAQEAA
jgi:hypothetical protein